MLFAMRAIFAEAARTAHLGIEVIPQLFGFENALNVHLRRSASGRRLNGKCRQSEPALNEIAAQVNVLDASIREMNLMPEKNSPTHRHAIIFKFEPKRFVLEEQRQEHHHNAWPSEQRNQRVVLKK